MTRNNAGPSNRQDLPAVTTYIRHQPLFVDENDKSTKHSQLTLKSLQLIGLRPHHSRTRATLRLLASWDGRDALFQLAQAIALFAYSLAPVRRKQLHIASESVANARRVLVIGKWINEGGEAVQQVFNKNSQDDADDDDSSSECSSQNSEKKQESRLSHEVHDFAQSSLSRSWRRRLGSLSEYLLIGGEACELTALLGGSSVLWRVLGGKLAARQRKGLERIALVFMLFGFLLGLRHLELSRKERLQKLKASNNQLLRATDMLTAEADAETIFSAHRLTAEEVLALNDGQIKTDGQQGTKKTEEFDEKATVKQDVRHNNALRRAERKVFVQRKKMQLLRLERASMRAELLFVIAELFWPRLDHTRLEAVTSLFAALCHMSRLTKETRWK